MHFVVTSIFLLENLATPPRSQAAPASTSVPRTLVLPPGFEPGIAVPKTAVISVSPREQTREPHNNPVGDSVESYP